MKEKTEVIRSKTIKHADQWKTELWLNRNVNGLKGEIRTHYGQILIWKTERKRVETKRQTEISGKHGRDG